MARARAFVQEASAFLACLVLAVLVTSFNSSALAASATCGAQGNYHVGVEVQVPGGDADGVQSDVEARFPDLCTSVSTTRFSDSHVMIYRSNGIGWAQIGVTRDTSLCCFRFVWQWKKDASSNLRTGFWGNPSVGTRYNLKVTRRSDTGRLHMLYLDPDVEPPCDQSGFCPRTNFDPHQAWTNQLAQAFAETSRPGSDAAGQHENRASFADIRVRPLDESWREPVSWSAFNPRSCYCHRDTVSTYVHFRTWTHPINHGTTC